MAPEACDLKYFGSVQSRTEQAANYTTGVAGKVYSTAKDYVPERAQPTLKALEHRVAELGSPVLTTLQDQGGRFLQVADSKLDGAANSAFKLHDKHYPQFEHAKSQYGEVVQSKVAGLRQHGVSGGIGYVTDSVSNVTSSAVGSFQQLPQNLNKRTEIALDQVENGFNSVVSSPTVQKLWAQAQPTANFLWKKYLGVHDVVVAQPLYKSAYGVSSDIISNTQSTGIYKATVPRAYSIIAPVADPVLNKICSSDTYKLVVDQIQPASA